VMLSWSSFVPASFWYQLNSFAVLDAIEGEVPKIVIDRTIARPFLGKWTTEILRRNNSRKGFTKECAASGVSFYHPDNQLPDNPDLNWWTTPVQCNLRAGTYFIRTNIVIETPNWPRKEVTFTSNQFHVHPVGTTLPVIQH
jgi:hypothetical protein